MRLSHSKLSLLLSNPMEYYLCYRMGITPKVEKTALSIGSAVHWGIENDTEDLTGYFGDRLNYGRDQLMAEAMVHGYFNHKDEIFNEIITEAKQKNVEFILATPPCQGMSIAGYMLPEDPRNYSKSALPGIPKSGVYFYGNIRAAPPCPCL